MSPDLLVIGEWHGLYLFEIGLALICLAILYSLPLTPPPRFELFDRMDAVSLPLLAGGFGLVAVVLTFGPLIWWTEAPWLGICLATGLAMLTAFIVVETRQRPTLNLGWISTWDVLALAGALLVFRFLLSEQTVLAVQFFRQLGLVNEQEQTLFAVVLGASAAGYVCTALLSRPGREPLFHVAALALVAVAAFMDSRSTSLSRPQQFFLSQAMVGFAGGLFLPTAMLAGMRRALAQGIPNIINFIIIFAATQSIGSLLSSAALQTLVTVREKLHSSIIAAELTRLDPLVAARVGQYGGAYARFFADPGLRNAEGIATLGQLATRESYVLAYNDAFRLVGIVAIGALLVLMAQLLLRRAGEVEAAPTSASARAPAPAD